MIESSLLNEYQKLSPGVSRIFVVPEIPQLNKDTSYLYQFYKEFLNTSSPIKIVSFNASLLPKIILSRLKFEKSILHYHWFEFENLKSFIGIKWKLFWIILYKILGGKIIWTVHNRYPHHNKFIYFNKKIRKFLAGLADKLHVNCKAAIEIVAPILSVDVNKFFATKHPYFPASIFGKDRSIENLNRKYFHNQLNTDDKIFLMFGAIAEYKGIKEVIEIFKSLNEKNKLIIAGFVKRGNHKYFNELKALSDNKRIFLEGSLIPDDDVPYFLNSADYTIFNYKDILTSGGIELAMSYQKKVIAPQLGCIKDIEYSDLIIFDSKKESLEQIITAL